MVSIAFVVTLNVINRQEAEEGFLDVIDTFNGGSERFSYGAAASPLALLLEVMNGNNMHGRNGKKSIR